MASGFLACQGGRSRGLDRLHRLQIAFAASTLPLQASILTGCSGSSPESYTGTCRTGRPGLAHRLVNFLPNRLSGIAPSAHVTTPKFSPVLIVLSTGFLFGCHTSRHSGDWLFALPIASCSLKLDDEAVKVSIAAYDLCVPHLCRCGSPVDARSLHGLVCKQALGRSSRHHMLLTISLLELL